MELEIFAVCQPQVGSKFIAFYADGSGASLYLRDDNGDYYTTEGDLIKDNEWFIDSGHFQYAYLPDDFKLWFENEENKP